MTKIATGGHPELKMVNPTAAAIDIGSTMHMAAVNPDACDTPVRAFGTFTQDLHDLADSRAPLAFLSPKIQAAILERTQPAELSLERLVRAGIPFHWTEQEAKFGFC